MGPVFPLRQTFYYEICVFLHVYTHAKTFPAHMFFSSYHLRAMMYLIPSILLSIPTIFILHIIRSTLIVAYSNSALTVSGSVHSVCYPHATIQVFGPWQNESPYATESSLYYANTILRRAE
jgi:hypothetical protein